MTRPLDEPTVAAPGDTLVYTGTQPAPFQGPPGYEILGVLGRGGMGVVYRARQIELDRLCALKMILAGEHADAKDRARFRTEAQASARLQHPGIVQVFEVGEHAGCPFLALEFCPGGTLRQRLANNPLPAREAALLVRSLAEAVQAAHAAQVLHRDLKPANVLLGERDVPKISDFGLAKKLDEEGATQAGVVLGTPSYMPPEQARGEAVDARADVYALGAILYECLTGRPPFRAATMLETLAQVREAEPVAPRQLNAAVPRDLETIALKCLAKEPGKRYVSAQALADDLGRYLEGRPIAARPVGPVGRGVRWVRRNPVVALLSVAVVVALAAGAVASTLFALAARAEAKEAKRQEGVATWNAELAFEQALLAEEGATAARTAEGKARVGELRASTAHLASLLDGALREWEAHDLPRVEQSLGRFPTVFQNSWETRFLRNLVGRTVRTRRSHEYEVDGVVASPDGSTYATAAAGERGSGFGSANGELKVWEARTGRELRTIKLPSDTIQALCYSPDGKSLVTAGGAISEVIRATRQAMLTLWDVDTGAEVRKFPGHSGSVTGVAFSPDGKSLVSTSLDKTVRLWEVSTGRQVRLIQGDKHTYGACFSPDGTLIAAGEATVARLGQAPENKAVVVRVWDAGTGAEKVVLAGLTNSVRRLCFGPEGKTLAGGGQSGEIKVWETATGKVRQSLLGHPGPLLALSIGGDGTTLLSASTRGNSHAGPEVRWWDLGRGEVRATFKPAHYTLRGVCPGPQGSILLAGGEKWPGNIRNSGLLQVWVPQTTRERLVLTGHTGLVLCLAFSPDDRFLVSGGGVAKQPGELKVWDVRTGAAARDLPGHAGTVRGVAFSPDGRTLYSGGNDGALKAWDFATGQERAAFRGHRHTVHSVQVSRDGRLVVSAGGQGLPATGPDGSPLVGELLVWEAATGVVRHALTGHKGGVNDARFSPDGALVASGGDDSTAKLWDVATGQLLRTLKTGSGVKRVRFSPDGKTLATCGGTTEVSDLQLWVVETGKELCECAGHTRTVLGLAVSPDGTRLASSSLDKSVRLWHAQTGQTTLTHSGLAESVFCLAYSNDGLTLAGGDNKGIRLWEARVEQRLTLKGHPNWVTSVAVSKDGRLIVSGGRQGTQPERKGARLALRGWNAHTGEELWAVPVEAGEHIDSIAISPDGKAVATWARAANLTGPADVRVHDALTGVEKARLPGFSGVVQSVAYRPDGAALAACNGQDVRTWDAATGAEQLHLKRQPARELAFSPDGTLLALGGSFKGEGGSIRLLDARTGEQKLAIPAHATALWALAYRPDGKALASASAKPAEIKVWDSATGKELLVLRGASGYINSLAFSPDGRLLVSGGGNPGSELLVWDAVSGKLLASLPGSVGVVRSVAFTPDGKRIVAGSGNLDAPGELGIWDVPARE